MACLHGVGGPHVGESPLRWVIRLSISYIHPTYHVNVIKLK